MGNCFFSSDELDERDRIRLGGMEKLPYSLAWFEAVRRPVYFYGAGEYFPLVLRLFTSHSLAIAGVVDGDSRQWGKKKEGIPVLSPDEFLKNRNGNEVVVLSVNTGGPAGEIAAWCERNAVEWVDWITVNWRSEPIRWEKNLEDGAEEALTLWRDDRSRQLYRQLIRMYASFSPARFPAKDEGEQYFQKFVPMKYYRSFVDLGAYQGDTLEQFRKWTGNDFDAYYAFEAFPDSFQLLTDVSQGDPRIKLFPVAVSNKTGTAGFSIDGSSNDFGWHLDPNGEISVRLDTVDNLLNRCAVGLIKMDIEGAELDALEGAARTIADQAPALAISVYHKLSDLWVIPTWIRKHHPGCDFYLRHHTDRYYETVCYAVPNR